MERYNPAKGIQEASVGLTNQFAPQRNASILLGLVSFLPKYGGFGETVILDRFACKTRYEQTLKK